MKYCFYYIISSKEIPFFGIYFIFGALSRKWQSCNEALMEVKDV